ncbi:NAD(P)-binding domain-containing protein [Romeria aff. gracilis LEGE 07310]|uniref:NAD(P)-binding domain-containing protein n=1 Tax=Vasconcelosia minhoensis LEGE 07310 TaxID=915328 RepID=A0A8J7DMF6_9CYAN|nr:NAD(P)-binding domain-containing protein [Romeria gracilis]MBE9078651.1 NAD(P)-binding domain-containing protein [Romeria aff. gracilis LEGE 07310]
MKIGIIGSGNIGGTLGRHWAKAGHEVMFSSRNPESLQPMADAVGAQTGTVEAAADFGEVILLAVPYAKVPEVAQQVGPLEGKILIDAGNPYPQRDGEMAQRVIDDDAQTATGFVAAQFPGAQTVKAFNSVYYEVLDQKAFRAGDERIAVQICSDDPQAKQTVIQLIEAIGFAPQDIGDLDSGTIFEPNAPLYNKNLKIGEAEALLKQLNV